MHKVVINIAVTIQTELCILVTIALQIAGGAAVLPQFVHKGHPVFIGFTFTKESMGNLKISGHSGRLWANF